MSFQTPENADINPRNMPNIALEINPHVAGKTYTSMVWVPDPAPVTDRWSGFINRATTGAWYFTNPTVATATGCDQSLNMLPRPGQGRVGGTKRRVRARHHRHGRGRQGRDDEWVGAVDGLR